MSTIQRDIYQAATHDLKLLLERTQRSYRGVDDDPSKGWKHETEYTFTDGTTVMLESRSVDFMVFPAQPGIEALYFNRPNLDDKIDPAFFDFEAHIVNRKVIGWELSSDCGHVNVEPITTDAQGSDPYTIAAIAYPLGRVEWWGGQGSRAEWIDWLRQRWIDDLIEEKKRAETKKPCEHCGRGGDTFDDDIPF